LIFAEDRVLVGVVSRKRDLDILKAEHWYRIPQARMLKGVHTEFLAFFLSGAAAKNQPPGVYYYAEKTGIELAYRRDLLPKETNHPRAGEIYYQVQFNDLIAKDPPITNPTKRPISFIFTTWDRFEAASVIADLYSESDFFVDRVFYALQQHDIHPARLWEAERKADRAAPGVRIPCKLGEVVVSTQPSDGVYLLDRSKDDDEILREILVEIARKGGAIMMSLPGD